ncbi:MAG: FecR domain-containing protein, partial [Bacteroidota bacterium]
MPRFRWWWILVALSLGAGIAVLVWQLRAGPDKILDVATPADGTQVVVYLPDTSQVRLNAASRLICNETQWADNPLVELEGEGWFELVPGSRVRIETKNGVVLANGGQF